MPSQCVLEASSDARPVLVTVSVYLYPAGAPTTYQGAFLANFIASASATGRETKVDYEIEPGKPPTGMTSFGRVTSAPGNYEFTMALLAEVPGHTDPHQFQHSVPVRVSPASAAE